MLKFSGQLRKKKDGTSASVKETRHVSRGVTSEVRPVSMAASVDMDFTLTPPQQTNRNSPNRLRPMSSYYHSSENLQDQNNDEVTLSRFRSKNENSREEAMRPRAVTDVTALIGHPLKDPSNLHLVSGKENGRQGNSSLGTTAFIAGG